MKSITYTYDNNGNLTAVGSGIGSTNYIWDWRDRLTQTATGTATTSYGYDHDNMRVRRTILGSATTTYPNQWFNYSTSGTTTANILLPNGTPIATVEANGTATTTYWLHPDHLGGTHTVTNASGTPVQSVSYLPYGDQRLASSSSAFDEKKKFTGHEFDSDSDLTYAKARYYEQDIGRWISVEPIIVNLVHGRRLSQALRDPQVQNAYSYARNNPLILKDESGEWAQVVLGAGAGIAAQYAYDVYNNSQVNGFSSSDFYSGLSSPGTYATRAAQGALVTLTGGIAGGGIFGQSIATGVASGVAGAGGNWLLGERVTPQTVVTDALIGGLSFGALRSVSGVPGRLPNFGTQAFYLGRHAQQSAMQLGVGAISNYTSQLVGNFNLGSTYQSRSSAVQSYNSGISPGFVAGSSSVSSLAGTLWTLSNGAVVSWEGTLVAGPTAQSTPSTH